MEVSCDLYILNIAALSYHCISNSCPHSTLIVHLCVLCDVVSVCINLVVENVRENFWFVSTWLNFGFCACKIVDVVHELWVHLYTHECLCVCVHWWGLLSCICVIRCGLVLRCSGCSGTCSSADLPKSLLHVPWALTNPRGRGGWVLSSIRPAISVYPFLF